LTIAHRLRSGSSLVTVLRLCLVLCGLEALGFERTGVGFDWVPGSQVVKDAVVEIDGRVGKFGETVIERAFGATSESMKRQRTLLRRGKKWLGGTSDVRGQGSRERRG
jgi:hypothetical protein